MVTTVAPALGLLAALSVSAAGLRLSSPDLQPGERVAQRFVYAANGCDGGNRSPALRWSGAPTATRGFAITLHDPDAPHVGGWWHWIVYALPPDVQALPRGASGAGMPANAIEGRNSFGQRGYGGPCPPPGDAPHRYVFTLYALDTGALDMTAATPPRKAARIIRQHALAHASLTVHYSR